MAGLRAKSKSLVSRNLKYPPTAKDAARELRSSSRPGDQALARGFDNLSDAVDAIGKVLREAEPEITEFLITDPTTGRVIAALGQYTYRPTGAVTNGAYFVELRAGDPIGTGDPANAILKVTTDGKVQIGQSGWVDVLDPYAASAAWIGTQFDTIGVTGAANNGTGLIRLTVDEDVLVTGDSVRVLDVGGVPNATGVFTVTRISATQIDLQNSVFVGTYASGGSVSRLLHITGAVDNGGGLIRITRNAHGYEDGDRVNIASVGGVPNATGQWTIEGVTTNTFDLTDSTFAGAYTSGGTALRFFAGGLFQTIAIGESFEDYKLRAFANGDLRIRDSQITLNGSGAIIDLDPVQGRIVVASTAVAQYRTTIADGTIRLDVYDGDPINGGSDVDGPITDLNPGFIQMTKVGILSSATSPMLDLYGYSSSPWGPRFDFHHFNGTPSSATETQSGDSMGGFVSWGFDGVGESQYSAGVRAVATENHTVTDHGTRIVFEVTPNGSTVGVIGMALGQDSVLDVVGGYSANGDAGTDLGPTNIGTSLTVGTGSAVFGTPGAGQFNGTVVTSVSLNVISAEWKMGLLVS